ncbi:MAG: CoA transferase, partial [Gammaproteobacteria bacterium]|nr:CoA transferase [Gammaproteobacteria bacterium]
MGPLAGKKIVEIAGLGPGPVCGMLLADMGAEVTVIDRPATSNPSALALANVAIM